MSSNKIIAKVILAAAFAVSSCAKTNQEREGQLSRSATFSLDKIEGEAKVESENQIYGIPTAKKFELKACLKDRVNDAYVIKKTFTILDHTTKVASAKGDQDKCLKWTEIHEYNHMDVSKDVLVQRTLVSQSKNGGELEVKFKINPWTHGKDEKAVSKYDKERDEKLKVVTAQDFTSKLQTETSQPLWVEEIKLKVSKKLNAQPQPQPETNEDDAGNGDTPDEGQKPENPEPPTRSGDLIIELSASPQVLLFAKDKAPAPMDLKKGTFNLELVMIQHTLDDSGADVFTRINDEPVRRVDVDGKDGIKPENINVKVSGVDPDATLIIGLIVEAGNGAPKTLGNFEGAYTVGSINELMGQRRTVKALQEVIDKKGEFSILKHFELEQVQEP